MAEQHSSRSIMWAIIAVAVVLIAVIVPLTIKNFGSAADLPEQTSTPTSNQASDDAESRIKPVAKFVLVKEAAPAAAAPAAANSPKDGLTVFNTVCSGCHNTGAAGSPKAGDKAAWAPRIAQGTEVLYKSALAGKNAMPAKGGVADLSDDEVKAAVDHLVGLSK